MSNVCAWLVALSSVSLTGDPQPSGYSRDAAQNLAALREYVNINAVNATDGLLILLNQVRTIEATARSKDQEVMNIVHAPDFEPWLASVRAAAGTRITVASASQNSVIQANSITAAGTASNSVLVPAHANSVSTLDVTFAVLEPVEVSITGAVGVRLDGQNQAADACVELFNNVTGTVFRTCSFGSNKRHFSHSGPIDVGVYTFHASGEIRGDLNGSDGSADAAFVVNLSVVQPGSQSSDLDADGDVDLFDYNKFQLEFSGPK